MLPPHLVSQPLKSALISTHNIPECDYVNTVIKNENDWNSLSVSIPDGMTGVVIDYGVCNDMKGDVVIDGLNCVRSITVKPGSMKYLNSLKICNCAVLEKIETENGSFENVKSVELSSLIDFLQ